LVFAHHFNKIVINTTLNFGDQMFDGKSGAFVVENILCNSFVWVFGDLPVPKDQLGPAQNASLIVPA
jgi:hypothetical protein